MKPVTVWFTGSLWCRAAIVVGVVLSLFALSAWAQTLPCIDCGFDLDRDGIPDSVDACPSSPHDVALTTLSRGCSASQLVTRPDVLLDPLQKLIPTADAGLDDATLFGAAKDDARRIRHKLGEASENLEQGVEKIAQGRVCVGARRVHVGREQMEEVNSDTGRLVLVAREEAQRGVSPSDPDADAAEVRFHELGYRGGLVGQVLIATRELDTLASSLCDEVVDDNVEVRGVVAETDDAARMAQLDDGNRIVLVQGQDKDAIYEGVAVRFNASQLRDKAYIPIGNAQPTDTIGLDPAPNIQIRCTQYRVAPLQPFYPPLVVTGPYTLHVPNAYEVDGTLRLEAGMRVGAASGGCITSGPGAFVTYRYSVKVEYKRDGGGGWITMGNDLTPSDHPLQFPPSALPPDGLISTGGKLRITDQRQICITSGLPPQRKCSIPQALAVDEQTIAMYSWNRFGKVNYQTTDFDLEDWNTVGFRVAKVASLDTPPDLIGATPVQFEASGYSATGSRAIETITLPGNPSFAIYHDDFYDPSLLIFPQAQTGVDKPSGLMWPRIVGQRNGYTFWYSAALPAIQRDLISACTDVPGIPNTYHRLPWTDGVVYNCAQGNNNPPPGSHNGSQAFAFDFSLPSATTIRASRGGVVEWLTESQTSNYNVNQPLSSTNQPFPNGSLLNWGNAVRIRHTDNTWSWYFHIQQDGVDVEVGDIVQRGQPIATSDNTGRSTGPHLHFQVQDNKKNWGQSIQISFDAGDKGTCYIPASKDSLTSNNANPNYP